ncbi:MAG: efflux RND transporter periplasmic adaptor subunit [Paracoccaceae bacterium]
MISSRVRRGAAAFALVAVATAAGAAFAPEGMRDRLLSALEPQTVAGQGGNAGAPAAPAEIAQPVRASVIRLAPPSLTASYTGTVRPRSESPIGFRVPGKIVSRPVDVGDVVAAGQVLATLDATDAGLALGTALAEQAAARTDLDRASAAIARSRTLKAEGHVAQAALDGAESDAAAARARLDAADASAAIVRNALAYATLTADVPGIVTSTGAEAGQVVGAGQPIVTIAVTGAAEAEIALPEQNRAELLGGTASATLWGEPETSYPLTLREVSPDVDPVSRTYRVRFSFAAGAAPDLGRTLTVSIGGAVAAPVATLPLASVHDDGTGPAVWRLNADGARVTRVPVELVAVGAGAVQVRGPLANGDRVVSLGAQRIDPGRPVRVVETVPDAEL